jgi:hypothetical protein
MKSKETALAYFSAFESKDRTAVRAMLADRGSYIGPLSSFDRAETFQEAADIFMRIARGWKIKGVLAEGDEVCILCDYETLIPSVPVIPMAQWYRIEAGKVAFLHLHFDPSGIVAATGSGELARTIASAS